MPGPSERSPPEAILDFFDGAQYEPFTASEIASETGYSFQTVQNELDALVDQGLLKMKELEGNKVLWATLHESKNDGQLESLLTSADATEDEETQPARQRLLEQHRQLAQLATRIDVADDLDEILQLITEEARELVGAHQSVTSRTINQNWEQAINAVSLSDKYAEYREYDTEPDGSGIYSLVCERNQPMRMTQAELESHPAWNAFGDEADDHPPMRGWLVVPIVGPEGQNIGLIQLSDKYQGEFTEADEAILIQLANIAAATIENARLYDELRESEERYRTLVENFPGGAVTLYDEDLRYIAAGGENVRRVGRTVDDLVGSKVHDAIPDELADQLAPHYRAAIEEEEQQTFEAEYDGTYYLFHALPVRDEVGDVYARMGMSQDITKQKERQRALEEYKAIIETIPDGVYILDEDHRFQLVNEAFFELTGYPREELLGSDPKRVSPEDGHERGLELRKQLRTGEIEVAVHEQTIQTADGDTFDAEIRFVALDDEDDDFRGTAGVIRDITERKEHEQELEQYRALTQAANDTIITIDDTSTIQSVNPAVEAIFGYEPEELIGERLTVLMPNELAERHLDAVSQYLATGERTLNWEYIELPGQHQNGSEIPLAISFNEAEHAADQFFTGIVRDISERKEYERKLEESNERLEQFAYAVSHDLQEPLRMVSSYLQLLENRYRDELDDDAREFIDFAVDGADRMSDMIEGLLEYSRVESQGDPFERVELDSILDDVREDLQFQIEESGAEITADTLPRVEGDANQLRQVLQNLVENAIAYSGEAPPCVHVSAKRTGSECVVSVEDDGIGIDRDEQDRIFEVFQRLHTHDEGAGTGIGLALCRRIVERHGGEIWVESDPGEGSTFYFTLPDIGHYSENH